MAEEITVTGVVLRRRESGENDRRLSVLSREQGRIEVIAKGARKSGSRLAGAAEPLSIGVMYLARTRKTWYLTQVQPRSSFPRLRQDFERLSLALSLSELYAACAVTGNGSSELFDLLVDSLEKIESHNRPQVAAVWAQMKLLEIEGVLPNFQTCTVCDRPLSDNPAWVSPSSGGLLCAEDARDCADCFHASAEVLIGLTKIVRLSEPPGNLKMLNESFQVLFNFWREFAHAPLPATESAMNFI